MARDDYAEHWREWVGFNIAGVDPLTQFVVTPEWEGYTLDTVEPCPVDYEIGDLADICDCCAADIADYEPVEFVDWYQENEEVIEEDFEGVEFHFKLLVKDWLSQAYEAGGRR